MNISEAGLKIIKDFEGYHRKLPDGRCTTYYCPAGVLTIGWGTTTGIKPGDIWTKAQAEARLKEDVDNVYGSAVNRLVKVPLTQNQFDALTSFTYNVGEGGLAKSSLLAKLNRGDYLGASQQFQYWNKSRGRVLQGLIFRRARETALFNSDSPMMPQKVEKQKTFWDWFKW